MKMKILNYTLLVRAAAAAETLELAEFRRGHVCLGQV